MDAGLTSRFAGRSTHRTTAVPGRGDLTRPIFLSVDQHREVVAATEGLFDLLRRLPDVLFGGDLRRCADDLGLSEDESDLVLADVALPDPGMGRADLCWDGRALRLVEFNVGGNVGGWDIGLAAGRRMDDPVLRDFCSRHELVLDDPGAAMVDALHRVSPRPDPVVAVVCSEARVRPGTPLFTAMTGWLGQLGLRAVAAHHRQLAISDSGVAVDGLTVDVVYRMWGLSDIRADPTVGMLHRQVARAARRGRVGLHSPLSSELACSKGALGLLSEAADDGRLNPVDAALVARTVPWTRRTGARWSTRDGQRIDLVAHARERREGLVLKPELGLGGTGVLIGAESTPGEWSLALDGAQHGGFVVQERVQERLLDVPRQDGSPATARVVLGALCAQGRYAGCLARAASPGDGGVVNTTRGASEGFVLRASGSGGRR